MAIQSRPNIAARLTSDAPCAIAVIRIRGPRVIGFLNSHFSRRCQRSRAVHGELRDGERTVDDPVVALLDDELAEINLHGGTYTVAACLELLQADGFIVTSDSQTCLDPCEGAIEREVAASLSSALTKPAIKMLLAQPRLWRTSVERYRHQDSDSLRRFAGAVIGNQTMRRMLEPARVAVVGAPNVGKSTLCNRLFGAARSITADLPGTTRDYVSDTTNLDGLPITLIDTPGQRASTDPIEQAAISQSLAAIRSADVRILVLDRSRALDAEQRAALARFGNDAMIVANKTDCPSAWDTSQIPSVVAVAARTGSGFDVLSAQLRDRLGCTPCDPDAPMWWTPRQLAALNRVADGKESLRAMLE